MTDRIRIEKKDGVADVRMTRGAKLNALDLAMFGALIEAGLEVSRDRSLRAVVLSGEGRAFCAGLDIPSLMQSAGGSDGGGDGQRRGPSLLDRGPQSPANFAQRAAWVWQEAPVPVIAAVHGVAFGGGIQLALGADIRFVTPDARLAIREIHWGLIPDVSGTQTLRHLVGLDIAKELTFTGREVSGEEAVRLGLATHVSAAPHEDAMKLAQEIAGRSPTAVRAAKRLWNQAAIGTHADGLLRETELQRPLLGSHNQLEAVRANMQKRAPVFEDGE